MIQTQTNEATEMINNQSDTNMSGTGIGNSAPNINLDEREFKNYDNTNDLFNPFDISELETNKELDELINNTKQEDTKKDLTQGEAQTEIDRLNSEIEKYFDNIRNYQEIMSKNMNGVQKYNAIFGDGAYEDLMNSIFTKDTNLPYNELTKIFHETYNKNINEYENEIYKKISEARNRIEEIKNSGYYDNRTDEQKREDTKDSTAYQTVVDDMRKAGINPAAISGVGYAGGGGGGSSKSEEEEEKRKRKKRELLLAQQQEELRRRQETMQILGMLTGMGGLLGSSLIRNIGYANFWGNYHSNKNNTVNTKSYKNKDWVEDYWQELLEEDKKFK